MEPFPADIGSAEPHRIVGPFENPQRLTHRVADIEAPACAREIPIPMHRQKRSIGRVRRGRRIEKAQLTGVVAGLAVIALPIPRGTVRAHSGNWDKLVR